MASMKLAGAAVAALTLVTFTNNANATIVTFDSLSGSGIVPNGYGGINWNGNFAYYDASQFPFTPESPSERAYGTCDCDTDNDFYLSTPTTFQGAYFAGQAGTTNDFEFLLDGKVVATSASINLSSNPEFLASGYSGLVDEVDVQTSNPGYWVIDNVTYAGAAPEPSTWLLMTVGLGSIGFMLRRARKTMKFRFGDAFAA